MVPKKILVVDDDLITLELIRKILDKAGYSVITSSSPQNAIELFKTDPILLILSDYSMPKMNGIELFEKLKDLNAKLTFLILTSNSEVSTVISMFKKGIHDYILKPFTSDELVTRIDKAFEFTELKFIKDNIQREREARIEYQLNWNLYRESLIRKETDRSDSGLMSSINSSLVQGAGLGSLSALVRMIKDTAILQDDKYLIEKDLVDTLYDTSQFSEKLIYIIGDIDYVINNDLPKTLFSITELQDFIKQIITEVDSLTKIRNQEVKHSLSSFKDSNIKILINKDYFSLAFKELLTNAFKFSAENSKIYILYELTKSEFNISILNSPTPDTEEAKGINSEQQILIFEPFYRLSRTVFEAYNTLDFGLGLTFADKILRNHKAKIRVNNLKNFLENSNNLLVSFTIELPFLTN
jgi:CheY-like chemotaxis protein